MQNDCTNKILAQLGGKRLMAAIWNQDAIVAYQRVVFCTSKLFLNLFTFATVWILFTHAFPYNNYVSHNISSAWSTYLLSVFIYFEKKKCLWTRNSVEGNGRFQIHMWFSLSKSNVGINRLVHQHSMFHNLCRNLNCLNMSPSKFVPKLSMHILLYTKNKQTKSVTFF